MKKLSPSLKAVFYLIVIIWLFFGIQSVFHYNFQTLGIYPRMWKGLIGILFAPFIHSSLEHIAYNTVPLFILSLMLAIVHPKKGILIWWILVVVSGFFVWVVGKPGYNCGSSYLIFAIAGYLISYGIFRRNALSLIIALVTAGIYGAFLWGILPQKEWMSWQNQLIGFVAGLIVGYVWGRIDRKKSVKQVQAQNQQQSQSLS
jgi:membrane associated rhomboid family serine protease